MARFSWLQTTKQQQRDGRTLYSGSELGTSRSPEYPSACALRGALRPLHSAVSSSRPALGCRDRRREGRPPRCGRGIQLSSPPAHRRLLTAAYLSPASPPLGAPSPAPRCTPHTMPPHAHERYTAGSGAADGTTHLACMNDGQLPGPSSCSPGHHLLLSDHLLLSRPSPSCRRWCRPALR